MTRRRAVDIQVLSSSRNWLLLIIGKSIVTIGMQDESELLFLELDDDYFGVQDDSDACDAATSYPTAESASLKNRRNVISLLSCTTPPAQDN